VPHRCFLVSSSPFLFQTVVRGYVALFSGLVLLNEKQYDSSEIDAVAPPSLQLMGCLVSDNKKEDCIAVHQHGTIMIEKRAEDISGAKLCQ
jgi:hypothetical protein